MPQITLSIKSQKTTTSQTLSAGDIRQNFLFGIDIRRNGQAMPDSVYEQWIKYAKKQIEDYLSIKLDVQVVKENKDFHYDDWVQWAQVKATYPIVCPIAMGGWIGSTQQVDYPLDWLSVRRTSDNELYSRLIHVLPNQYTTYHQAAALYTGFFPNMGWMGAGRHTPEYWQLTYITGFIEVPADIMQAIGMLASINILAVANETLAAAMGALGGSSKSISIDGLSESTSLYINGQTGIFGARIKQYIEALTGKDGNGGLLKQLQDYYGNFVWTTL